MDTRSTGQITLSGRNRLVLEQHQTVEFAFADSCKTTVPNTPSAYFSFIYPELRQFGAPILELQTRDEDDFVWVTPVEPNIDFFAAILGSKANGSIVYYKPEARWYQLTASGVHAPATNEEIRLKLSLGFLRCIEHMSHRVNKAPLFLGFRSDEMLDRIIARGEALLGVDEAFFKGGSHKRTGLVLTPEAATKRFVEEALQEDPDQVLAVSDAYTAYRVYCHNQLITPLNRANFEDLAKTYVKQQFGVGIRKDLKSGRQTYCPAWKAVALKLGFTVSTDPTETSQSFLA